MQALLGHSAYERRQNNREVPVIWDAAKAINPHWLILGTSGSGKTYTIRRLVSDLARTSPGVRIHIADAHGDIDVPGASTVRFSQASNYGYNPLTIDPDPEFGGVNRRINAFVTLLSATCGALGNRQEAVLRALLADLYQANGFYADNPRSWGLETGGDRRFPKKFPQFSDAIRYGETRLRATFLGTSTRAAVLLEKANRAARKMTQMQRNGERSKLSGEGDLAKIAEEFERAKAEAKDAFIEHLDAIKFGREFDDVLRYDSPELLRSIIDRLRNLESTGIFRDSAPPFSPAARIWRYDLQPVPVQEQRLFVTTRLEEIFREAVQAGITSTPRTMIVLDEAHRYASDDPGNILNRIMLEGRKFGVGIIAASQSTAHFSQDLMQNVGCKVILGLDASMWGAAVRSLRIDERMLQYLTPKRTMAVQIRQPGEMVTKFMEVVIPSAASPRAADVQRAQRTGP